MVFNDLFIIDRQEFKQFSLNSRLNIAWIKNVKIHINDIFIVVPNCYDNEFICKVKSLKDNCEFRMIKFLLKKYSKAFLNITYETGRLRLH